MGSEGCNTEPVGVALSRGIASAIEAIARTGVDKMVIRDVPENQLPGTSGFRDVPTGYYVSVREGSVPFPEGGPFRKYKVIVQRLGGGSD